jgi:hypothetical protein
MKIGLSLSFCIRDIIEGRVNEEDVICIISNTKITNMDEFDSCCDMYCKVYWLSNQRRALYLAMKYWQQGRIIQPRTFSNNIHYVSDGHWIDLKEVN